MLYFPFEIPVLEFSTNNDIDFPTKEYINYVTPI